LGPEYLDMLEAAVSQHLGRRNGHGLGCRSAVTVEPADQNQREGYDARAQPHYRDSLVAAARATKERLRVIIGCISLVLQHENCRRHSLRHPAA
jgi:hypothetical protein